MKRLTKSEFLALDLNCFVKDISVTDTVFNTHHESINELDDTVCFESWSAGYCTLSDGDVSLGFAWTANGGQDSYETAFEFDITVNVEDPCFELSGCILVDEEGEPLEGWELRHFLREFATGGEWESHVRNEMPTAAVEEIEMSESNAMNEYTVERDNDRAIKFKGELVASAASSANQAMGSSYSGSTGRWKELGLYKTQGGKFICEQIERTKWQGERDRYKGAVCDTIEQVVEFFGNGWLAKELYSNADIDASINVD